MAPSARRRLALLSALIAAASGCSELYVEQRFRYISIGMSEERMTKIFGPPWHEVLVFKENRSRTSIDFQHGHVVSIDHEDGDGHSYSTWFNNGQAKFRGTEDAAFFQSCPVKLMMTHAEFDPVVTGSQPTEDCRKYFADARAKYDVCFKDGRVISKELQDVPPV